MPCGSLPQCLSDVPTFGRFYVFFVRLLPLGFQRPADAVKGWSQPTPTCGGGPLLWLPCGSFATTMFVGRSDLRSVLRILCAAASIRFPVCSGAVEGWLPCGSLTQCLSDVPSSCRFYVFFVACFRLVSDERRCRRLCAVFPLLFCEQRLAYTSCRSGRAEPWPWVIAKSVDGCSKSRLPSNNDDDKRRWSGLAPFEVLFRSRSALCCVRSIFVSMLALVPFPRWYSRWIVGGGVTGLPNAARHFAEFVCPSRKAIGGV